MSMKICPSCGAAVPSAARRCKECFHDFDEEAAPKSNGLLVMLASFAAMAVVGAGVFWYISSQPVDTQILVSEETRTIQWVQRFSDGSLETDQVGFDQVAKLEYVVTAQGDFEIIAVTTTGDRKMVMTDPDKPLRLQAEKYAEVMEKPLDLVDESMGLGQP